MLSWPEKLQLGVGLVPAYLQGQRYVEAQEGVTVQEWMDERGIPKTVTDEVFLAMSKALGFIGPEQLSMQCVLIALNRFLQETSGSRIAFLDGSPTERLCEPLREYIEARGGIVRTNTPVRRFLLNDDHTIAGLLLPNDEVVSADCYVNAMPVDALKTLTPSVWRDQFDYFRNMQRLKGVPVMNLHLWFDRKLSTVDNLIFSRSPLLSVYADMSETCAGYASSTHSMLELVLAPAAEHMRKSDAARTGAPLSRGNCRRPELGYGHQVHVRAHSDVRLHDRARDGFRASHAAIARVKLLLCRRLFETKVSGQHGGSHFVRRVGRYGSGGR